MDRACSTNGGRRGMHVGYWWESQRLLGRPRRRWVVNIKMDFREIGWDGVDWYGSG
jgi:hypothetical protein